MKNFVFLLTTALLLASCATSNPSFSGGDDVYFSLNDAENEAKRNQKKKEEQLKKNNSVNESASNTSSDGIKRDAQGNIILSNDYADDSEFNFDDYYDYSYAARVKRFGNTSGTWNYYDPYYTNSYWYNQNPMYYGTSIYNSYYWWNSNSFFSPWSSGWGWNNPYNSWGYAGWNTGWNSWGWNSGWNNGGWNTGWNGFNNGFWTGPNYYNSFDNNSHYYGPRKFNTGTGTNGAISFSKVMQDNGLDKDLTKRQDFVRPDRNQYINPSVNTNGIGGNTNTTNQGGQQPNTGGFVGRPENGTKGNGTTQSQTNGITGREDQPVTNTNKGNTPSRNTTGTTQNNENINRNTTIPPVSNTETPPQGKNRFDNSSENGIINNNRTNTNKSWDQTPKWNGSPAPQNNGQRSGTFGEGSRSGSWGTNNNGGGSPQKPSSGSSSPGGTPNRSGGGGGVQQRPR